MVTRTYSAMLLSLGGIILMGLGVYFVFVRPALLPEDPRYMGTSLDVLQTSAPGLLTWLRRVFWVMGGYIFSTGLLTLYIAVTAFRRRAPYAALVLVLTGVSSIGWMAVVNFIIGSDFKWLLLAFALLWPLALALYWLEGNTRKPH